MLHSTSAILMIEVWLYSIVLLVVERSPRVSIGVASSCPDREMGGHVSDMVLLGGVGQVSDNVVDTPGPGLPDGVVTVHRYQVRHSVTCSLARRV